MKKYYWKTKNEQMLDVDTMSEIHVRNALKYLIRKLESLPSIEFLKYSPLQGEVAQDAYDEFYEKTFDKRQKIYNKISSKILTN